MTVWSSAAATRPAPASAPEIMLAGAALVVDPAGALYWPDERLLAVADLHLEKGSSFARRGMLLPPYDTAATLERLRLLVEHHAPALVVALGDSFHDGDGPDRLAPSDRAALAALQSGRDWIWIAGNHDPAPARRIGGQFAAALAIGPLTWRHEPTVDAPPGEIAGHLHPVARIATQARVIRRRCFVADDRRIVMPAFGAYAGGLNVRDAAFGPLLAATFTVHVLGQDRIHRFASAQCVPD